MTKTKCLSLNCPNSNLVSTWNTGAPKSFFSKLSLLPYFVFLPKCFLQAASIQTECLLRTRKIFYFVFANSNKIHVAFKYKQIKNDIIIILKLLKDYIYKFFDGLEK